MDIKKAWENKTVRLSVIGALLVVIVYIISQSIFSTPVKKEKKTQKKDMQTNLLLGKVRISHQTQKTPM
ncbi:Uncharacterised protein [Enterobacter cloacae]|nr:Uncharacterised protein [Enterobacter cloacae]